MDMDTADSQQLDPSPVTDEDNDQPPGPSEEFPDTEEATTTIPATDGEVEWAAVASSPPRRALKLVVTVEPAQDGGDRAVLALGADGCDPVLRVIDADLAGALQLVPGLLAEAEARWQLEPRYPSAIPTGPTSTGSRAARAAATRVPPPGESAEPTATSDSDARAQLDLFA